MKKLDFKCKIFFDNEIFVNYLELAKETNTYLAGMSEYLSGISVEELEYWKNPYRSELRLDVEKLKPYRSLISISWHSNELTGWLLYKARKINKEERRQGKERGREFRFLRKMDRNPIKREHSVLTRVKVPAHVDKMEHNVTIIGGKEAEDTYTLCKHFAEKYPALLKLTDETELRPIEKSADFIANFSKNDSEFTFLEGDLKAGEVRCLAPDE